MQDAILMVVQIRTRAVVIVNLELQGKMFVGLVADDADVGAADRATSGQLS